MLDPFTKYKVLASYDKISSALKGQVPSPKTVEFFLSDKCNHSCIGCHSKELQEDNPSFLDIKNAKNVLDELTLLGVESIEISGGGEPLLYPDLKEFVLYAKKCGFSIGMISNLSIFEPELYTVLVKNLTFIRVALDSSNKETYKQIHQSDSFDILLDNVSKLFEAKKRFESNTTIGAKFLVSKKNNDEILSSVKLAKKAGFDYIQFKALRNSDYALSLKESNECNKIIVKAKSFQTDKFRVFGSTIKTFLENKCYLSPLHPLIDSDGLVYLCAHFQNRRKTHKIGDIYSQKFLDFWGKKKHLSVINNIKHDECNVFDCPFHEPNKVVEDIKNNNLHLEFI